MDSNKTEVSAMQPLRAARVFPAAALAVTGLAAAGCAQANDRQEKPNVILIYIDDMGYSDISAFGGNYTPTPNIDRIGQEGIQFNQYYTACPISSPSRVGVTTGMYPTKWGITTFLNDRRANCSNKSNDYLRPEAPTLARSMKAAGYATGHFGKWHMGGGRDVKDMPQIPEYGFDEYSSTWESPDPDPLLTASNWIWSDQDSVKRWERTEYFVDKTLDFLKRHKGQPCYVDLWPDDMHTPYVPSQEAYEKSGKGGFWEKEVNFTPVLAELDRQIGRLLDGLEELGIADNTIIIFTSDNGPERRHQASVHGALASKNQGRTGEQRDRTMQHRPLPHYLRTGRCRAADRRIRTGRSGLQQDFPRQTGHEAQEPDVLGVRTAFRGQAASGERIPDTQPEHLHEGRGLETPCQL